MLILTSGESGQFFFSKLFLFLASDVFFNFFQHEPNIYERNGG